MLKRYDLGRNENKVMSFHKSQIPRLQISDSIKTEPILGVSDKV